MSSEFLPYRPNVCILLRNQLGELLLGERLSCPGAWQFPQGGVEIGSSVEDSVYREIEEELGIMRKDVRIVSKLQATHTYDFIKPPTYALNRWRGQTQTFWLVDFLGSDSDITVATEHPEFRAWQWCPIESVLERVEPIRRKGYVAPLEEIK
jgi:putative (di)nucleoside polyphosphate hydrolase